MIFDWAPLVLLLSLDQSESESSPGSGAALGGARFFPSAFEVVAGEAAAAFARLRAGVAAAAAAAPRFLPTEGGGGSSSSSSFQQQALLARSDPTLRASYERDIAELEAKKAALTAQVKKRDAERAAAVQKAAEQDAAVAAAAEQRRLHREGSAEELQAFEASVREQQRAAERAAHEDDGDGADMMGAMNETAAFEAGSWNS